MDLKTLFDECAKIGNFPEVEIEKPVRHSKRTRGRITAINIRGLEVKFPDLSYNTWFWWQHQNDKRSHYVSELRLAEGEKIKISMHELTDNAQSEACTNTDVMPSFCQCDYEQRKKILNIKIGWMCKTCGLPLRQNET